MNCCIIILYTTISPSVKIVDKIRQEGKVIFHLEMSSKDKEHTDLNLCCALFACVGVGYLFPFSALTQPVDYWKKVFPDRNIEFPLVTLYMWTNLICLFVMVFCVKRYLSNVKFESL